MQAIVFILDALLALLVLAFMLRVLMPLVRADFRNPVGAAVLRITDPIVLPLRRLFKPAGRVDVAALVALLLVQLCGTGLLLGIGGVLPTPLSVLRIGIVGLLRRLLQFYQVAIFAHALLSWLGPGRHNPAMQLLDRLCEPLLAPVRRVLPAIGGLDLSPLAVLIGLQALLILLR